MRLIKTILVLLFLGGPLRLSAAEDPQKNTELIVRLGNESNPVDGVFGPFTFGVRGNHQFSNEMVIEGDYIRLHEPNAPTFQSVLDEGQLTLRSPARGFYTADVTVWKNRMIDMYTNLVGVELMRKESATLIAGAYLGTATLEDISGNFRGLQAGVSGAIGPSTFTLACLFGKIDDGAYRKCGIDSATDFREQSSLPLTLTFAIEERYYDFGNGRPVSEPQDEFIFITGLEIHLEKLLF